MQKVSTKLFFLRESEGLNSESHTCGMRAIFYFLSKYQNSNLVSKPKISLGTALLGRIPEACRCGSGGGVGAVGESGHCAGSTGTVVGPGPPPLSSPPSLSSVLPHSPLSH